ncbi:MAG TPA: terminase gpA endonuclease subunit [Chthoniobacterales bacterium]|nr:terminase gpA endonuclease subunit [Chthoniobacterales bacterium]
MIRATIRPRPRMRMWQWLDKHVVIPEEASGPCSGRLRTSLVPIFRGLYDIVQQSRVHYFAFCASARIGKTLFSICILLYWIAERFGAPVWLDPTRSSANKLVRSELDEFLLQCAPVRELAIAAPPHPASKKFWTTLTKCFRGKLFRIIGSGAEADLHGFNAELAINNELDRQRHALERDAASADKIEARTKLFSRSRLILDNSTPGDGGELSPIWQKFLARSQRYCYLPCPHCSSRPAGDSGASNADGASHSEAATWAPPSWDDVEPGRSPQSYEPWLRGWQRLTFGIEQKLVPFDENLERLPKATPREKWREEVTGQFKFSQFAIYEDRPRADDPTQTEPVKIGYDLEAVENGTTYECAHCKREIDLHRELRWMEERFRWIAHNPFAPADKESAHCWAAYNPFEHPGIIAKEFLEAKGNLSALIKFRNLTQGLPFVRQGASIKEDDLDRVVARTPVRYVKGQIPMEAECLTMTVDRQDEQFWFAIRAWGILWDHPERPTWSALVDWGEAVSEIQILELAGLVPNDNGKTREFKFVRPDESARSYCVTAGLMDSGDGDHTKDVYEFCLANREIWSPYKGGDQSKTLGSPIRLAPIMDKQIDLVWAWSNFFADNLYYDCIKNGASIAGPIHWWLPTNIDRHYREQLTDEYRGEENGKPTYISRRKLNHLGDCEKMQRCFTGKIEERFDEIREERMEAESSALESKGE